MRISSVAYPVSGIRSSQNLRSTKVKIKEVQEPSQQNYSAITFKGGNKEQVILFMAESEPYWKNGGVATVMTDMRGLRVSDKDTINLDTASREYWAPKNKAMVDHIYNGMKIYDYGTGVNTGVKVEQIPLGLNENSPFKPYEGKYFLVKDETFQKYQNASKFLDEFEKTLKGNTPEEKFQSVIDRSMFILDDVTGPKKMLDFGGTDKTEVKLFRVLRYDKAKKELYKTSDFKIFTDLTAGMKKPYEDGGYATSKSILAQSWKGDAYAKSSKAFVELMERICEEMSAGGEKFDPATVLLNDSQVSYTTEYMAEKAAKGDEFWQGKKPTMIVHNAGDGYVQKTSYLNMFVNLADEDLRKAIEKDPMFIEALKRGDVEQYFAKLLPAECIDAQGGVSPFRNTLYYARLGYVPKVTTVSEKYAKALCTNPDLAPGNRELLDELYKIGRFDGNLNGFQNESMDPYKVPGLEGYKADSIVAEKALFGNELGFKLIGYKAYDSALVNSKDVNLDHVRDIKRYNKISLLSRFDENVIRVLETEANRADFNKTYAGASDKKVRKLFGHIDSSYVDMLKRGEDVKLFVSWGRGDAQKAMDTVMQSFLKYIEETGNNNALLIMGGEIPADGDDAKAIRRWADKLQKNPLTSGRFAYIEGFAPNKVLASAADYAILPSRFAPCELTDFESMKVFCTPIVANCQGLAQKNFDRTFKDEAERVTGYKTTHEYYMTETELANLLPKEQKEKMEKDVRKFKDKIINDRKLKYDQTISEEEALNLIRHDGSLSYDYNFEVLRPYRDQVIADELVQCYKRADQDYADKDLMAKMFKNQAELSEKMGWETNGFLHDDELSSAEKYRKGHFQADSVKIKEEDTLLYKLRKNCREAIRRGENATKKGQQEGTVTSVVEKTHNKLGLWIGAGVAAVATVAAVVALILTQNNKTSNKTDIIA